MRLALSEGRLSRWKELRDELTPRELNELIAYSSIEPWGDRRADIRQSLMTSLLINATNGNQIDLQKLTNYMESTEDDTEVFVSPNAAAATMSLAMPNKVSR